MNKVKLIELEEIKSQSGSLSFFEMGKDMGFEIKRIYYIYKFLENGKRGFHAHKILKQIMFCPYGKILIEFTSNREKSSFLLDSPNKMLVIEKGYWREFTSLEEGSILCVGASDIYDEKDYIRDYEEYLRWEAKDESSV